MAADWLEIAEWDWVVFGSGGRVLHAVEHIDNAATADEDWHGDGRTECGRRGAMFIPGVFTRMGAKRCERCCKARRMPQGKGSPKNDDACRPRVEGRVAAMRAFARAFDDKCPACRGDGEDHGSRQSPYPRPGPGDRMNRHEALDPDPFENEPDPNDRDANPQAWDREAYRRQLHRAVAAERQLAGAVSALEHILESAEHPSLTVRSTEYIAKVARDALANFRGQSDASPRQERTDA